MLATVTGRLTFIDTLRDRVACYVHEHRELNVAGAEGLEPPVSALEADGLPLTDAPIG